jgi:hypothetical protein
MRRYSSLILLLALVLSLPGCASHKSVRVSPSNGAARNSGDSGSPTALSNFIQATLRISQENTVAAEESLKQLHKRRPHLGELSAGWLPTEPTSITQAPC